MSDVLWGVVVGGLIGGFFSFITTLMNQRHNERLQTEERQERLDQRRDDYREWYSRTLFEKRLAAVQQAYVWLMRINEAMNLCDSQDADAEWNKRLRQICREAREWYDQNTIYLYDDLPGSSEFIGLTNLASGYASRQTGLQAFQQLNEAIKTNRERARRLLDSETAHGQRV